MPSHRGHEARDTHDAALQFVELILRGVKPADRVRWVRRWLPQTFGLMIAKRDFEVMSRSDD